MQVGIDLGTTNSAVAWVDDLPGASPRLFEISQLLAVGEVGSATVLPSFIYFPTPDERDGGALALPWDPRPDSVAGIFARERGALVPTRLVSSAKSWLANPAVDRRAPLLPWTAESTRRISPVEAS